jgi:single-stranded-DNA-specific exonuclease
LSCAKAARKPSDMVAQPSKTGARSVTGRTWIYPNAEVERAGLAISQRHSLPEVVGRVLAGRGVELEEAAGYLSPSLRDLMPDPSILKDMDIAADRLAKAVKDGERIALFGDYDVDGGASVAVVQRWLCMMGLSATLYIPDRIDEGYGPNVAAMEDLAKRHTLILCLDCGTLSHEPIAAAMAAGAEVIVADHHLAGETLPDCSAVVNPNRQDDESGLGQLCAAGVAFLLLAATNRALRPDFPGGKEPNLLSLLDLVALATVADVAPLTGLNRAFVRQGLTVMRARQNAGLKALADVARMDAAPTAFHLGFLLGPRVNAGGRVGRADMGARLLCCDDPEEAVGLAGMLDDYNGERRAIEAEVQAAAIAQAEARGVSGGLVWAAGEGWHPGVVGIVASRLKEQYNRPAIVIGLANREGKGSGRSIGGVDLGRAVQAAVREGLLIKGGGHKMAAGLTLSEDKLADAMAWLDEALSKQGADSLGPRDLTLDGTLSPRGATLDLCEMLEQAGPFGAGAPAPRFAFRDVQLMGAREVGDGHLAGAISSAGGRLDFIAFRAFQTELGPAVMRLKGAPIDAAGRIQIDEWRGSRRVKLHLADVAERTHP